MITYSAIDLDMPWSGLEYRIYNGSTLVHTTHSRMGVTKVLSHNRSSWSVMQVWVFADGIKLASIPAALWAVLCTNEFWQRVRGSRLHYHGEVGTPRHDKCVDAYQRWQKVRR